MKEQCKKITNKGRKCRNSVDSEYESRFCALHNPIPRILNRLFWRIAQKECRGCRFWRELEAPPGVSHGVCKRHAPRPVEGLDDQKTEIQDGVLCESWHNPLWPKMFAEDGCGDWELRVERKERIIVGTKEIRDMIDRERL